MAASTRIDLWAPLAALAVALMLAACATTPPAETAAAGATNAPTVAVANAELDNAADGARVTLKRGGELKVILDANVTTGFQWAPPKGTAPVLAPIGDRIYVNKAAASQNLGRGGSNIFRFRAEQGGTTTLQFDYGRAWETNVAPARTVRYRITVE